MSAIKYYSLDGDEEVPYEFVVVRNVNGKPEFCASFVNTNCLAYENGVLLKYHERNDELRAENAKLRKLIVALHRCAAGSLRDLAPSCVDISKEGCGMDCTDNGERCFMELLEQRMQELGIEVDDGTE